MILWGTVTTLSGLVHNYSGLLAVRFFLGLCEGGLLPGIVCACDHIHAHHLTCVADVVSQYAVQTARIATTVSDVPVSFELTSILTLCAQRRHLLRVCIALRRVWRLVRSTTHVRICLTFLIGLLATAIVKMDGVGNVAGWKWIFILEGMATVVIALVSMIFLPADLQTAKFFSDEERAFACEFP